MNLPGRHNLCAIVTSFNPDSSFEVRLSHIANQIDKIVIIDNHSDPVIITRLREISARPNVFIIYNTKNLGVATALNQGVIWAKENNYEWVLLFDQDTLVSDNLVELLSKSYKQIEAKEKVGMIGTGYSDKSGKQSGNENSNPVREVKFVITSGSMISVKVLDEIGPFRDDLFIDFIDIEYCLRVRKRGYKIMQFKSSLMQHNIGSLTMHHLLWKDTATSNHSPFRRYFMMRNHIIVVKKYFFTFPGWAFASLFERLISTFKMCMFESERIPKLKYSTLGFIDGITGKCNRIIK